MPVIHVTAIQDGYTVVRADAHADKGPTAQCRTPNELRMVLRSSRIIGQALPKSSNSLRRPRTPNCS